MVTVIRVNKKNLLNDLQQKQSKLFSDSLSKVSIKSHKLSKSVTSHENSSNNSVDNQETIAISKQSVGILKQNSLYLVNSPSSNQNNNQVLLNHVKNALSPTTIKIQNSLNEHKRKRNSRRRCSPFLWSKPCCCCCVAAAILTLLGLGAAIAAIMLSGSPKGGTTSSTVSQSVSSTTSTAPSTTITSATTSASSTTLASTTSVTTTGVTTIATTTILASTTSVTTTGVTTSATTTILASTISVTTTGVTTIATTTTLALTTSVTTTIATTVATSTSTSAGSTTTPFNSTFNTNLLTNGNGETGPCQTGSGITHPTGWDYNGTITQVSYNNPTYGDLTSTDPGPSNRGQCYFFGQISTTTSMWQTVNLTNTMDPLLIDNHTVKFNLSAWLGGWSSQNDNAQVSVVFFDETNHILNNATTIGPVLAAARGSQSSLLFRQANGLVPVGSRSLTVIVTITCITPTSNDGDVDNIGIYLYQ